MWMTFLVHAKNRQSNVYASFPFYIRFYTFEGYVSEKHTFFSRNFIPLANESPIAIIYAESSTIVFICNEGEGPYFLLARV